MIIHHIRHNSRGNTIIIARITNSLSLGFLQQKGIHNNIERITLNKLYCLTINIIPNNIMTNMLKINLFLFNFIILNPLTILLLDYFLA